MSCNSFLQSNINVKKKHNLNCCKWNVKIKKERSKTEMYKV